MADSLLALLAHIRTTRRTLAAGEVLFRAGDPVQALFHVEQGRIRLSRAGVTLFTAGPGQPFGEAALFTETQACDAVAVEATTLRVFPKTAVLLLLKAHADLNLAFSAYLAREADRLRGRAEILATRGARDRVLAWLVQAGAGHEVITTRPLTEVAADLGLTREALYRTLAKLEAEGRIVRQGKRAFRLTA